MWRSPIVTIKRKLTSSGYFTREDYLNHLLLIEDKKKAAEAAENQGGEIASEREATSDSVKEISE